MGKCHVIESTTNPTVAPTATSVHWLNTATKEMFYSVGTGSVNDWVSVGASSTGGGGGGVDPQTAVNTAAVALNTAATASNLANINSNDVDIQDNTDAIFALQTYVDQRNWKDYFEETDGLIAQGNTQRNYFTHGFTIPEAGLYEIVFTGKWSIAATWESMVIDFELNGLAVDEFLRRRTSSSNGPGIVLPNIDGGTANTNTDQVYPVNYRTIMQLAAGPANMAINFGCSGNWVNVAMHYGLLTVKRWLV